MTNTGCNNPNLILINVVQEDVMADRRP